MSRGESEVVRGEGSVNEVEAEAVRREGSVGRDGIGAGCDENSVDQAGSDAVCRDIPLSMAFMAPALFGTCLLGAELATLAVGLPEDIAHGISSLCVLAAMAWLYQSFGLGVRRLSLPALFSGISAGIMLQAVSIGAIAVTSKIDTAATVAVTLPYLLRLCVIDPVAEELCFRGLSLTALERRGLPFWTANLVQAGLFAAFHFNIVQSAYAFASGLVLGGLRQRDGIGSSLVAHCVCNLAGLVLGSALAGLA